MYDVRICIVRIVMILSCFQGGGRCVCGGGATRLFSRGGLGLLDAPVASSGLMLLAVNVWDLE